MASLKIMDERKRKEVERICSQSDELKDLQKKIMSAYQNKERAAQITEKQYRQQVSLEQDTQIDKIMLRTKEIQDQIQRESEEARKIDRLDNKNAIQTQIVDRKQLEVEAQEEYLKERDQVDAIIQRMISEDREMARIQNLKMQQAQADMILSVNEKRALVKRQQEMEAYENEMVR